MGVAGPRGYNVSVWPLSGPGADDFLLLHVNDPLKDGVRTFTPMPEDDRIVPPAWHDMVVLLDFRAQPVRVYRYNYDERRVQPRWVGEGGNEWLSRRTLPVPLEQQTRLTQGARRVSARSQQAKPEVPDEVHFVDWHTSLGDLLDGKAAAVSILFPSETTGDFPEHMALVRDGAETRIVALGTTAQTTGESRAYEYTVDGSDRIPAFTPIAEPIGGAQPVQSRVTQREFVTSIITGADGRRQVLVWNGNAYTLDNGTWTVSGLFALSQGLGGQVAAFSSAPIDERLYYVSDGGLLVQGKELDDESAAVPFDGDVVSVSPGPRNSLLVVGAPIDKPSVANVLTIGNGQAVAINREQLGLDLDDVVHTVRYQPKLQRFLVVVGARVLAATPEALGVAV